jgi:citrate synthase
MKMLLQLETELPSVDDVGPWVRKMIDEGRIIMGMGHAVYKTADPRAKILKGMSRRLTEKIGHPKWYEYLVRIEQEGIREFAARGKTGINTNVDFYSGSVYASMGIPTDIMTPVFAISRISGWCAHIIEEKFAEAQEKPALYRPEAEYVGNYCGEVGCVYQSMAARG